MNIYIVPYIMGSESAKVLAQSLGAKLSTGKKRFVKNKSFIINWGCSDQELFNNTFARYNNRLYNKPSSVIKASNKIETFKAFVAGDVPTVEWTTDRYKAMSWVNEDSFVYARLNARSSQGEGIQIVTIEDTMPYAPLYTKGVAKAHEYRVHVFKDQVIDYTKKRRRSDTQVNPYIKNFNNGWVFCRDGIELPKKVMDAALKAVKTLDLSFCALDILYREREDQAYVLEANTAPGLEGTTLIKYTEAFKKEIALCQIL